MDRSERTFRHEKEGYPSILQHRGMTLGTLCLYKSEKDKNCKTQLKRASKKAKHENRVKQWLPGTLGDEETGRVFFIGTNLKLTDK